MMRKWTDSKDRLAYFETVIINHDNNGYQLLKNMLLMEVVEEEEEELGDKEQTSMQRVMKIEIMNRHNNQYHQKNKIHHFTLSYNPKVLEAKKNKRQDSNTDQM